MTILEDMLRQVDDEREDVIELAQALVRIPSVNTGFMPTGGETPACELARDWLAADGIESEILEATPGRGNLIARMEGRSGNAGLMFMSHTDVVPVEDESKWRFPPFSATIHNDRIYGRGASDCKGLLAAHMAAMRILKRNDVPLEDSLVLATGADEEHGGRYGFKWLMENHSEVITAPYAVNEGAGESVNVAGGLVYVLGVGEKGRLQIEIDFKGSSAHASTPWKGTNAAYSLAQAIERIKDYDSERDTSVELFDHLSTFAIEHKPSVENIDEIVAEVERENPPLASLLRALSRMTVTPTMVKGGVKSNSVPETIRLTCDVRTLPHQDEAYVVQELSGILAGIPDVDFSIDYMAEPNSSPFDTEFVAEIKNSTSTALQTDNIQWAPGLSTGFTDSRFTRQLGVDTYGLHLFHADDDPILLNIHGTDESEGIKSIISGVKIFVALAYNVLAAK